MWFFFPAQYSLSALTGLPQCSGVGPQPFLKGILASGRHFTLGFNFRHVHNLHMLLWKPWLWSSWSSSCSPVHDLHILFRTTVVITLKLHLPWRRKILKKRFVPQLHVYCLPVLTFAGWTDRRSHGRGRDVRTRAPWTNPGLPRRSRTCRGCEAAAHGRPSGTCCIDCLTSFGLAWNIFLLIAGREIGKSLFSWSQVWK